ncbi:MAG: hypothetical protein LBR57_00750 [Alistipes sp.]|jgi:hypothetical protein|nr:hypothetical protein [Alistipes sp.]
MRKSLNIFFLVVFALSVASCGDDMYDNSIDQPIKLSMDALTVDLTEQTVNLAVTARDGAWTVTGAPGWLTVSPSSGERGVSRVTLSFAAYEDGSGTDEDVPARTATLLFSSGEARREMVVSQLSTVITPPNVDPDYEVNAEIHALLAEWYYNGEPKRDVKDGFNQLYNQKYDEFYFKYLSNLSLNELERNSWAVDNEDVIHSYIERTPSNVSSTLPRLNYGMEFDMVEFKGRVVGRVLYVEPGSPAANAGLNRGDWFWKVNGVQMQNYETNSGWLQYNRLIDTLVHPVRGESPRLGMLSYRSVSGDLVDEGVVRTLTPANHANEPILATQVFSDTRLAALGGQEVTVGYMMYNNFNSDGEEKLINTFRRDFAGAGLDYFILDLRYNKTGSARMAELMGNLLVGNIPGVAGQTFARYRSDGNSSSSLNRTVPFATHTAGIAADTLFILTSRHTAGPAELLINALRGLDQSVVKLVTVGETTRGLSAGMVRRDYTPSGQWKYSAWMLACHCYNAAGNGDWAYGLMPNGMAVDEWKGNENLRWSATWGYKYGVNLQSQDQFLRYAVEMIRGSHEIPAKNVENSDKRQLPGLRREFCFPANLMME